ncbi:MAG: GNAT family protein [Rhodospirillaceae bacterium]
MTALAMFVRVPNYDNIPCFQIGYAVPKEYRDQGRAKEIVTAAIAELKKGMGENGVSSFYIEAIVEHNNTASLRVASSTVSPYSTKTIDCFSGNSALQYIRKVVCDIVS